METQIESGRMKRLAYRVPEAAEALGISRAFCYMLVQRGELPSVRIGSSIRVPAAALEEYIETLQAAAE